MNKVATIRPLIAFLLLLTALLGSMPKKYWHDALAGHTDATYGFKGKGTAVAATVYQCGFDHQVAESPFEEGTPLVFALSKPAYPGLTFSLFYTDAASGHKATDRGRGPPAAIA